APGVTFTWRPPVWMIAYIAGTYAKGKVYTGSRSLVKVCSTSGSASVTNPGRPLPPARACDTGSMRKRSRKPAKPKNRDANQAASATVQHIIDQFEGGSTPILTPDGK